MNTDAISHRAHGGHGEKEGEKVRGLVENAMGADTYIHPTALVETEEIGKG